MTIRTQAELAEALYGTPQAEPQATVAPDNSAPRPRTEAELGEALYGKKTESAPVQTAKANDDTPPVQRTSEQLAEALYPEAEPDDPLAPVPPEVGELRNTLERRMYPAQNTLSEAIPDSQFVIEGVDAKTARNVAREVREMAADLDLSPRDIDHLKTRVRFVSESKPDVMAQREAAVDALNRAFGNDAKQALRDARAFLQRDPRTAKIIEALGVGDDPEVVVMIARAARGQRVSGKFKGAQ